MDIDSGPFALKHRYDSHMYKISRARQGQKPVPSQNHKPNGRSLEAIHYVCGSFRGILLLSSRKIVERTVLGSPPSSESAVLGTTNLAAPLTCTDFQRHSIHMLKPSVICLVLISTLTPVVAETPANPRFRLHAIMRDFEAQGFSGGAARHS